MFTSPPNFFSLFLINTSMFSNTPMFSSTPASTSNANTLFGAQTSTATNNTSTLFGANPPSTTIPTSTSSSVFGGLSNTNNAVNTNSNTLTGSNTSFNTINNSFGSASTPFNLNNSSNNTLNTLDPNNANQKPKLLDLDACMETVVPLYVVTANNVTRTSIPSNFFQKEGTSSNSIPIETKDGVSSPASFGSSLVSSNHSSTLPTYLTCYDNNHSVKQKESCISTIHSYVFVYYSLVLITSQHLVKALDLKRELWMI